MNALEQAKKDMDTLGCCDVSSLMDEIERLRAEIVEWDRVCKQHVKQCQKLSKKLRDARKQERDRCANDVFALAKVMDSRPSGATVAHWLETAGYRILKLKDE